MRYTLNRPLEVCIHPSPKEAKKRDTSLRQTGALSEYGDPDLTEQCLWAPLQPQVLLEIVHQTCATLRALRGFAGPGAEVCRVALFHCFVLCGLCREDGGFYWEILSGLHGDRLRYVQCWSLPSIIVGKKRS